jgi:hypothetical protein
LWRAAGAVHREFAHHFADKRSWHAAPEEDLFLFGPYLLLAGMAVENLLKGVLLQRRPTLVRDGRVARSGWSGGGGGHNLRAMAREVSPALADRHVDLLVRLEAHVVWGGRYPVPLKAAHFVGQPREGGPPTLRTFRSSDPAEIQALFDDLVATIDRERPPEVDESGHYRGA